MNAHNNTRPYRRLIAATFLALVLPALPAGAVFFDLSGEVTSCNAFACDLAGITTGDLISGYFEVDGAAAGPISTFSELDVLSYQITVGGLVGDPSVGGPDAAALMTDADGEIVSGTALIVTVVDAGILGMADVDIDIDAGANSWTASTTLLGLGEVASGDIFFTRRADADVDGDGIADVDDNCVEIANPDQRDTNGDLYGNLCDPDLNNDGEVNTIDLGLFKQVFFSADPDADFNGDDAVNPIDLGIIKTFFFQPPGPSGPAGDL